MVQYYIYRARTPSNKIVTGRIQAVSLEAARKILQKNNLTPVSISLPKTFLEYIPFVGKVSLKDRTLFARQLATMIEAGLTLAQSLRLLVGQTRKGKFQTVMTSILNDIQDGFSFSNALAKHPDVFDTIFINVVRSGEATGKMEMVLKELARNMEKDVAIRSKIRGALFYPGFILVVMLGVGLFMTTQVIPQLKEVFLSSGQQLPTSTSFLLGLSDLLVNYWYFLLLGLIAFILLLRIYMKSESGIRVFSKLYLKMPIMGIIIEQSSMARFGRLLGMLLSSGVPLLEALKLINDSFTNTVHKDAMTAVSTEVERGIPMSVPIIARPKVFPAMVAQMVAVGEQTGKMDEVMTKMAEYYESEVESKVAGLATLIEPVIIVILGLGVGWLVQAILLPIYTISTNV